MAQGSKATLSGRWALPFLGVACAVGVASIYFNQPLLMVMGHSLGEGPRTMGFVAVATQVGYAAGLLLFVPLGDIAERRTLMMRLYGGASVALLLAGLAHGLAWMIAASVLIGMMASVTHVALPMAPDLVPHERRGQAIGTVMTGLLLGILLARSFAGWVSRLGGWRTVFFVAAVINAAFIPAMYRVMPRMRVRASLTYADTMRSLWTLVSTEPLLREAAAVGALAFASFSCFWTTIVFLLQAHYGMGPGVAGTFGVVGAAGAMVAPFAGRLSDARGTRFVVTSAGAVLTFSYLWMWVSERAHLSVAVHMVALVFGVLALDVGAQMMQVANQTRIFGLGTQARSRLNTIYMTIYFTGGAIGSALATLAWARWQWDGVCLLELCLIAAAGLRHATGFSRKHPQPGLRIPAGEREPA
ncbi:MAG TPA: MFS transporter [Acidobacteriaceae bacterium]|jgi:predicted MFS family arabinose efflux permease|nr:MFS transporter [Acidobacteriaceae bacterium]